MSEWQPGDTLASIEKNAIIKALRIYGSKQQAANALGVSVKTIYNKLEEYGILDPEKSGPKPATSVPTQQIVGSIQPVQPRVETTPVLPQAQQERKRRAR